MECLVAKGRIPACLRLGLSYIRQETGHCNQVQRSVSICLPHSLLNPYVLVSLLGGLHGAARVLDDVARLEGLIKQGAEPLQPGFEIPDLFDQAILNIPTEP